MHGNTESETAHRAYLARSRFGALDGLRALAIAAVLVHHSALAEVSGPWSRGFLGVDLFFVISGFLITTLLLREYLQEGRISLTGFYWRRILRILPLYYLLVTAVGCYFVLWVGAEDLVLLWPVYYLFLANFLTEHIPTLYPTWSLSMEEQFYLLWPLAMVWLPQRLWSWAIGIAIALNIAVMVTPFGEIGVTGLVWGPLWFHMPDVTYTPLLLGAGLALLLQGERGFALLWRLFGGAVMPMAMLAVVPVLVSVLLPEVLAGGPYFLVHLAMMGLLASLLLREDSVIHRILRWAPLRRVGTVSYGIYLLHLLVLHGVSLIGTRLGLEESGAIFLILYWGGSYALAELSFRFYETAFLRLRHKPFGHSC